METATTPKIVLTDTGAFKPLRKGWYFQATIGPFESQQDAYEFVRKAEALPGKNETTTKDRFA